MDVASRLKKLMEQRGWTMYRLAKVADVPWSTVSNIFKKGTDPSISTLEIYCRAMGITLAQFFDEDGRGGLSDEQKALLDSWALLDAQDRQTVTALIARLARRD